MNEVCPKDSINWMKYYNFITTNNTNIYKEWTILRKWMEIKIKKINEKKKKRWEWSTSNIKHTKMKHINTILAGI